ncbi:hypothetical protein A9260_16110 [Vibrio sp. UCD-FRSSP16_30]|nr:hypothetical protein A9260_16110 [Vibrio sp. UCD-FRSSP16_30]
MHLVDEQTRHFYSFKIMASSQEEKMFNFIIGVPNLVLQIKWWNTLCITGRKEAQLVMLVGTIKCLNFRSLL